LLLQKSSLNKIRTEVLTTYETIDIAALLSI